MEITVSARAIDPRLGTLTWSARRDGGIVKRAVKCALGHGGITATKREGDGATPIGRFALRRLLYRADRLAAPATGLAMAAIEPGDGWCDDPMSPDYNRQVRLPIAASHEHLWRMDGLYDLIVVLGHNDDPVVPGAGSAIFLHVASDDYAPTAGCVAIARGELTELLADCNPGDALVVGAT